MNKKDLSERDICSKFIGPAVKRAGWDGMMQIREEVAFTKGRIIVRGKLVTRGKAKRADYILYYKPNIPIAIIEAKDNNHSVHTMAMELLQAGVDRAVSALWLGHESVVTAQVYLDANLALKEEILAKIKSPNGQDS
jgi:integrase